MSGNSPQTQESTVKMSPEQRDLYTMALPGVRSFAAKVPERYANQVTPFNQTQQAAQQMALNATGTQMGLADTGANAITHVASGDAASSPVQGDIRAALSKYTNGDIWKPENNPNLQGAIDASTRPIMQQLTEQILPQIRSTAAAGGPGQFNNTSRGIAEGIAARGAEQAVGDTASKLVQGQYDTNINAQLKALGLLGSNEQALTEQQLKATTLVPSLQGAQTAPAVTTGGVGDVRYGMEGAKLGNDVANFNYNQYAPYLQSQDILSLITGLPGGTATSTASKPQPGAMQALGGAAAGASLGSAIMPGIGTGVGAISGAMLPFLFR